MNIKETVGLFVPPIVWKAKDKLSKSKRTHFIPSPLPQIEHHSNKMVIIGNGPSLKESVSKYKDVILLNDRIAVNFFASSDYYEKLMPNIYVFADPAFFYIPDNQQDSIRILLDNILLKTTWSMNVVIPYTAKDSPLATKLATNNNITLNYYSNIDQKVGSMSKFEAWDKNLLCPPCQNVVNVALYLSLYWNYPETYLIGTDMSSLEDIRVDQETNELFSVDTHFYDNKSVYSDKKLFKENKGRIRSDWKLHEYIYAFGRMFEYFSDLKDYADYKGLKVYNASEYSWINVFERKKLS